MVAKTITRKKNPTIVKEELLKSLKVIQWNSESNIQNIIDQRKATDIVKRYEKIIKTGNKKQ